MGEISVEYTATIIIHEELEDNAVSELGVRLSRISNPKSRESDG
jgi:hypothetical protein